MALIPENNRERRLQSLAWGLLLIWFGIFAWLDSPPIGFLSVGIGSIILLENALRFHFRMSVSRLWVFVGAAFLVIGFFRASSISLTAALLVGVGIWILIRHVFHPGNTPSE